MTFDVMPSRDGKLGAWVFAGKPAEAFFESDAQIFAVEVLGVKCWFVSDAQDITRAWAFDFASRSLSNDATIEHITLTDFSVTMKDRGRR